MQTLDDKIALRLGRSGEPGQYELIARAIYKLSRVRGGPVTGREIMAETGLAKHTVYSRLLEMADLGIIRYEPRRGRTICLVAQCQYYRVPFVWEVVGLLRPIKRRMDDCEQKGESNGDAI